MPCGGSACRRSGPPGLALRADEGDSWVVGDGAAVVTGSRAGLLRWLARRIPDGVASEGRSPSCRAGPDAPGGQPACALKWTLAIELTPARRAMATAASAECTLSLCRMLWTWVAHRVGRDVQQLADLGAAHALDEAAEHLELAGRSGSRMPCTARVSVHAGRRDRDDQHPGEQIGRDAGLAAGDPPQSRRHGVLGCDDLADPAADAHLDRLETCSPPSTPVTTTTPVVGPRRRLP